MWNFLLRDSSREFPYEILQATVLIGCNNCFSLSKGVKKSNKETVTIFIYDKKNGSNQDYEIMKNNLKRLKTLRHPGIVAYLDNFENDDYLYIVTEYVEPLLLSIEKFKNSKNFDMYISWGIMSVMKAVGFLNSDGKFRHNNISSSAVFVTKSGEWKLAEFGYLTDLDDSDVKDTTSRLYGPPEVLKSGKIASNSPWSIDSWGLGILIWESFNGKTSDPQHLRRLGNIPTNLKSIYCELVAAKPEKRPKAIDVINRCSQHGEYFHNTLIKTLTFLDEIHLKNKEDVNLFFKDLETLLDCIPVVVAHHKVLPQITIAFEYGNEGACIIPPLLKIAETLDDVKYQKIVVPFVTKLYSSNDRATRSKLLLHIDKYIDKIPPSVINDTIFPLIVSGFMDTNPRIREQTIKAIVEMVPKLNRKNIDEDVLRHLARIQMKDEQGLIRTNTTVCLGKIAPFLNPINRSGVLISAFLRSLNDNFAPVKNAGILAFAVCQHYFSLEDISRKILPALCPLTIDPDVSVRENTFKTIKGYLGKLEKVSENPSLKEEMEKETLSSGSRSSSSWADWAVTAIASKFTLRLSETKSEDIISKEKEPSLEKSVSCHTVLTKVEQLETSNIENLRLSESSSQNGSGWDDDTWLNLTDDEEEVKATTPQSYDTTPKSSEKIPETPSTIPKQPEKRSKPPEKSPNREESSISQKKIPTGPMKLSTTKISQHKYD